MTGLRPNTDPVFLLQFLRGCKFDQERAFKKILAYYQMRKENPSIFDGLKPSDILHVYRSCIIQVHYPYRDRLGRKIWFLYPGEDVVVVFCFVVFLLLFFSTVHCIEYVRFFVCCSVCVFVLYIPRLE